MRIGLACAVAVFFGVLAAASAFVPPAPGSSDLVVTPMGGEVTVGVVPCTEAAALKDSDAVATGTGGRAIVSGPAWSAVLEPSTRAAMRTLVEKDGDKTVFRRSLELFEGAVTWKAAAPSTLLLPFGRLTARQATVRVYFRDGEINIDTEEGITSFEGHGTQVYVTLATGHRLNIRYIVGTKTFHVEVLEDKGKPIDILIGKARIRGTKGDVFDARIDGANIDLLVTRGLIQAFGPDGKAEEVGQGVIVTLAGAAEGAAQGEGLPEEPLRPRRPRRRDRDPVRDPVTDRTDLSPSGFR